MPRRASHWHASDLHGAARLALDATAGLTDLVEAMHQRIARLPGPGGAPDGRTRGVTGLVYRSVRGVTRLVGGSVDALLGQIVPMLDAPASTPQRDALVAALNGVLGDHLAASANPLATPMTFQVQGRRLPADAPGLAAGLAAAIPAARPRLLLLVHGLCMSDLQWLRAGHDHGAALARDHGHTPIYLRYNSGLHISTNGQALANRLEALLHAWPVPVQELAILGHSMGGLLARSACHSAALAGHSWPRHLKRLVFLGTPHHGAPLERAGHWLDLLLGSMPYAAPLARLGRVRSAGITDLRHGSLLDDDWAGGVDPAHGPSRHSLPLPQGVECHALAATTGQFVGDLSDRLLGDGLVPLDSALGRHADACFDLGLDDRHQWVGCGMNHLDLLSRPEVYEQLLRRLA